MIDHYKDGIGVDVKGLSKKAMNIITELIAENHDLKRRNFDLYEIALRNEHEKGLLQEAFYDRRN